VRIGGEYRLYVTQFVSSYSNRLVCLSSERPDAPFEHAAGLVPVNPNGKWRAWVYAHRCYEGSYLYRRGDWWYLFVSAGSIFEDGSHQGYGLYVGRSRTLDGDFTDRDGRSLLADGGTRILSSAGAFAGPGHNGDVFTDARGRTFMFFHSHWKGSTKRTLDLQELHWTDDGWPFFEDGCVQERCEKPTLPVTL